MEGLDQTPAPEQLNEVREVNKTKLLSQMVFKPGLPVWEYNETTKVLGEAKFKTTMLEMSKRKSPTLTETVFDIGATQDVVHRILDKQDGCMYFQALNRTNALRKIDRLFKRQ